jgi:hypothetical protein
VLLGKPEVTRRKWEDTGSVKINLLGMKFGDVDWIQLIWYRDQWQSFVNTITNLPGLF